jgi:hypothetical protein
MKTELKKVYYCEFCKKHSLSAAWISRHEKHCKARPENKHKCFDECSHLKRSTEWINENHCNIKTVFTCKITGVKMYSYLIEKRVDFKLEFIKDLVRMPIECKDHKYMTEEEVEKRFNPNHYESFDCI